MSKWDKQMEAIKRVRLSEIAELITKGTTPTTLGYNFQEDGVNFLKIECFSEDGTYIKEKTAHISEECHEKLKRSKLRTGDTIIGVAEGEATIYASYNEEKSNELTLKCIVNLNEIVLDKSELEIVIGGEQKIIATLVPENSTYKELNWQSSDNSIATVEDGLVKGCKKGRATISN